MTWETADTLRVGAKDVLNDFNKKWPHKYNPGPESKRKRCDEQISSATRKCRRPQITPTRNLHCRSHSGPCVLPICHRHCCGLPRHIAVHAKAASAAVLRHVPAVRAIAAHHDAAAGFANCNLDAQQACRPRFSAGVVRAACIVHGPCWTCGTNLFIGPTQYAVFHFTRTSHFRTRPAWPWHAQLIPITAI